MFGMCFLVFLVVVVDGCCFLLMFGVVIRCLGLCCCLRVVWVMLLLVR